MNGVASWCMMICWRKCLRYVKTSLRRDKTTTRSCLHYRKLIESSIYLLRFRFNTNICRYLCHSFIYLKTSDEKGFHRSEEGGKSANRITSVTNVHYKSNQYTSRILQLVKLRWRWNIWILRRLISSIVVEWCLAKRDFGEWYIDGIYWQWQLV